MTGSEHCVRPKVLLRDLFVNHWAWVAFHAGLSHHAGFVVFELRDPKRSKHSIRNELLPLRIPHSAEDTDRRKDGREEAAFQERRIKRAAVKNRRPDGFMCNYCLPGLLPRSAASPAEKPAAQRRRHLRPDAARAFPVFPAVLVYTAHVFACVRIRTARKLFNGSLKCTCSCGHSRQT